MTYPFTERHTVSIPSWFHLVFFPPASCENTHSDTNEELMLSEHPTVLEETASGLD